ncbi:MAG: hypothetical protein Kow00108_12310 [Calditrichia bacterium]
MKRFISLFLLLGLLVGIVGCSKDQSESFVNKFKPITESLNQELEQIKSREQFMGFLQKADSIYTQMKAEAPENASAEATLMMAQMAANLRKFDEAAAQYNKAIRTDAENVPDSMYVEAAAANLYVDSLDLAKEYFIKSLNSKGNDQLKSQFAPYFIEDTFNKEGKEAALAFVEKIKDKLPNPESLNSIVSAINLVGAPAPELQDIISKTNTRKTKLASYKGKVLVLDFWATWCAPCRQSIPALIQLRNYLQNEQKQKDFEVIGVTKVYGTYSDGQQQIPNLEPKKEAEMIKGFVKNMNMDYPIVIASNNTNLENYFVRGIPTFYLIDKQGVVRDFMVGFSPSHGALLKEKVEKLLAE